MLKKRIVMLLAVITGAFALFATSAFDSKKSNQETASYYYNLSSTSVADEDNPLNWQLADGESCASSGSVLCRITAPVGDGGHPLFDFGQSEHVRNSMQISDISFKQ